jgi:RNA polymerase sigma factor (sigma-70 family)
MPADAEPKYLDQQLLELLDRHHQAKQRVQSGQGAQASKSAALLRQAEQELADFIYRFVHQELKPSFRRSFPASSADTGIRYTEMLNNLFVEVLEKRPDAVWKAESTRAIARFVSVALRNDLLTALRAMKRRERREGHVTQAAPGPGQDGFDLSEDETLTALAQNRQQYFRSRYAIDLADALEIMATWPQQPAPWPEREEALRLRCIDGLTYDQIAAQTDSSVERVKRLIEEALTALRAKLS